jgi:hypothetical protein
LMSLFVVPAITSIIPSPRSTISSPGTGKSIVSG